MPPVAADSALGVATLALIAHERAGDSFEMHPILESAFQHRQLERVRVVLAAAGPILVGNLLEAADGVLWNTKRPEPEPGMFLVSATDLEVLRVAVAMAKENLWEAAVAQAKGNPA